MIEDRGEQALIARAKAGDQAAYESLLGPAIRPATRLAFAMLHDRSQAEDAFQESALRAWRRLQNLREGSPFAPWFMGIVANQCREIRRGRWRILLPLPDANSVQTVDESAWFEGEDLRRALMRLPYDQRAAILLHFHLDMPLKDVAIALGISVPGVKTRINRALKRLRPAMGVSEVRVNG
ncbi:MAG TPA: RNA polymerase sigma factor [Candidatus Dormibacteraeota bacterium]